MLRVRWRSCGSRIRKGRARRLDRATACIEPIGGSHMWDRRQIGAAGLAYASTLVAGLAALTPRPARAQADVTVSERSFDCIRNGTKVRNSYIRNADPKLLAEA